MKTFASTEDYYLEGPARRFSTERDFGVWWRDSVGGTWRVTYVGATGEVYALRLGVPKSGNVLIGGEVVHVTLAGDGLDGPLVVLGTVPPSEGECIKAFCSPSFHGMDCPADEGYNAEKVLEGWAEVCGQPDSLDWVKARVS